MLIVCLAFYSLYHIVFHQLCNCTIFSAAEQSVFQNWVLIPCYLPEMHWLFEMLTKNITDNACESRTQIALEHISTKSVTFMRNLLVEFPWLLRVCIIFIKLTNYSFPCSRYRFETLCFIFTFYIFTHQCTWRSIALGSLDIGAQWHKIVPSKWIIYLIRTRGYRPDITVHC